MPKNSMTREEVIGAIQKCAAQIGHVPSFPELRKMTKVRRRAIWTNFGTYTGALHACGMERRGPGYQVSPESLFLDWAGLTRRLGRIPSMNDYGVGGRYSVRPLLRCYRGWRNIPAGMMEYAKKAGQDVEWSDVLDFAGLDVKCGDEHASQVQDVNERARLWPAFNAPGVEPCSHQ
jgi:Homing endonuclease associated repeat